MPQQTISNLCKELNYENDNNAKFRLHERNPVETFSKRPEQKVQVQ